MQAPYLEARLSPEQIESMKSIQEARLSKAKALYNALVDPDPVAAPTADAVLQIIEDCNLKGLVSCNPALGECPAEDAVKGAEWANTWTPDPKNPHNMLKCVPESYKKAPKEDRPMTPEEEYAMLATQISAKIEEMDKLMKWQSDTIKSLRSLRMRGDCESLTFDDAGKTKRMGRFRKLKPEFSTNPINMETGRVHKVDKGSNTIVKDKYEDDPFVSEVEDTVKLSTDVGLCEESFDYLKHSARESARSFEEKQQRLDKLKSMLAMPRFASFKQHNLLTELNAKSPKRRAVFRKWREMVSEAKKLQEEITRHESDVKAKNTSIIIEEMAMETLRRQDTKCMLQGTSNVGKCESTPGCVVVDDVDGPMPRGSVNSSRTMAFSTCLGEKGKDLTWEHRGTGHKLKIHDPTDFTASMSEWTEEQLYQQDYTPDEIKELKSMMMQGVEHAIAFFILNTERKTQTNEIIKAKLEDMIDTSVKKFSEVISWMRGNKSKNVIVDLRAIVARYFDRVADSSDVQTFKKKLRVIAPTKDYEEMVMRNRKERNDNPEIGDIVLLRVNEGAERLGVRAHRRGKNSDYVINSETGLFMGKLNDHDKVEVEGTVRPRRVMDGDKLPDEYSDKLSELLKYFGITGSTDDDALMKNLIIDYIEARVPVANVDANEGVGKGNPLVNEVKYLWSYMFPKEIRDELEKKEPKSMWAYFDAAKKVLSRESINKAIEKHKEALGEESNEAHRFLDDDDPEKTDISESALFQWFKEKKNATADLFYKIWSTAGEFANTMNVNSVDADPVKGGAFMDDESSDASDLSELTMD